MFFRWLGSSGVYRDGSRDGWAWRGDVERRATAWGHEAASLVATVLFKVSLIVENGSQGEQDIHSVVVTRTDG